MDKFLPGIHLLPKRARASIGWGLAVLVLTISIVPIIALASMGPACGGGYPDKWCQAKLDTIVDDWGMYNRECVSYTAYKVASSGRTMPYGFGHANMWPDAARANGITVDGQPRVGDVAIIPDGEFGHSMYVEAVHNDGTISVSQYNKAKTGTYSQERLASTGMVFIHF